MAETYTIRAHCTNCDKAVDLTLPKGTLADGAHECPECGCKTAGKRASERLPKVTPEDMKPFWDLTRWVMPMQILPPIILPAPEPPSRYDLTWTQPHTSQPFAEITCQSN